MKLRPILALSLGAALYCATATAQAQMPANAPAPAAATAPALIPLPRELAWQNGGATLRRIALQLPAQNGFLRAETEKSLHENGIVLDAKSPQKISFRRGAVAGAPAQNREAYALTSSANGIEISAPDDKG